MIKGGRFLCRLSIPAICSKKPTRAVTPSALYVNNMEIIQGIVEGAQAQNAPLILQVSKGARAYANHTYLVKLVEAGC